MKKIDYNKFYVRNKGYLKATYEKKQFLFFKWDKFLYCEIIEKTDEEVKEMYEKWEGRSELWTERKYITNLSK